MTDPILHFLQAKGDWGSHRECIVDRIQVSSRRASALMALPPLDVVLKFGRCPSPGLEVHGYAPEPRVIWLTIDPAHLADIVGPAENLERVFLHELHHAVRWEGPGYGRTLGEALVTEGLAGQFVSAVCDSQPEPWESLGPDVLRSYWQSAMQLWDQTTYMHDAWFLGAAKMPNWLGYSIGYQLVGRFLANNRHHTAASLACAGAGLFRGYCA